MSPVADRKFGNIVGLMSYKIIIDDMRQPFMPGPGPEHKLVKVNGEIL